MVKHRALALVGIPDPRLPSLENLHNEMSCGRDRDEALKSKHGITLGFMCRQPSSRVCVLTGTCHTRSVVEFSISGILSVFKVSQILEFWCLG